MDVSVKGEYALRAVLDLACHQSPKPVKIAEIAGRQNIPQKFLELILSQLKQGGFLTSRRGADGGYFLAKPAREIRVGDVLRHIDGPLAPAQKARASEGPVDCPLSELWCEVEKALCGVLDTTTFEDLVERWREKRAGQVMSWQI